jgi:Protein of unknown function (DUF1549)/Protein of unknown function (DUF1553)/Bacterial Ig-like domain (group 2)
MFDKIKSFVPLTVFGVLIATIATPYLVANPSAPAPVPSTPSALAVFPPGIQLDSARDAQAVIAKFTRPDGITVDVTAQSQFTLSNPALAKIENGKLTPLADGAGELTITYGGQSQKIALVVKNAQTDPPISFKLDVMPVFLRAGCNTGGCHGSARGKDGFRLSLFGYDPDGDYTRITREQPGRRINLALPEESLLLTKSTGSVSHTGGTRFKPDSHLYASVYRWLDAGAPQDPADVAKPVALELMPGNAVLEEGDKMQFIARAKYSDGTDRDVTRLVLFMSNNDASAAVSEDGLVTAKARGEAFVMARFATFTVGSQVIVIPRNQKYDWPGPTENNYIDTHVNNKLKKLRILPSELCTDEDFLRRAYVDIIGLLPTREEYDKFANDADPKKREKLVDELLGRKEFVELWVMKWAELLQIRSDNNQQVSYKAVVLYFNWLQDKIANNVPFDQIVREMLSANGGTFTNPASNYYQIERDTLKIAENAAQTFMGMRIQCAQCHNHPFDRWTQDDYYGFAAYFAQVGRKQGEDPRETIVFNTASGTVKHPIKGDKIEPKLLGESQIRPIPPGKDRREVVAAWLASPENPYFAKNLANIVWAHFFGKGIIDPVDDVRISNPASNPELLEALGQKFTSYKYDFKRLVRDICTSRTYQLATRTNPTNELDEKNFSHQYIRRMRAEVALDVINQVTETKQKYRGLPLGSRAVQIADGRTSNYFLTTFGRATRDTVCSCEVKMEPNLSQALHLINGNTVHNNVASSPVIPALLKEKKPPQEVVTELYLRTLTRRPTAKEVEKIDKLLADAKPDEQKNILQDLFWALLNSEEFIFNH